MVEWVGVSYVQAGTADTVAGFEMLYIASQDRSANAIMLTPTAP